MLIGLTFASCGGGGQSLSMPTVPEAWISSTFNEANLDSVAFWPEAKWILATAKSTHEILVFDAQTGNLASRFGTKGLKSGQFQRPNGIAVAHNHVFVVERDNHRIQVLSLPDFRPVLIFGQEILKRPYGITIIQEHESSYKVYITDNHQPDNPTQGVLKQRIKLFQAEFTEKGIRSEFVKSFGSTEKKGALYKVESIWADQKFSRLLIAEERDILVKVYDLKGHFTGTVLGQGLFKYEPEGIALYSHNSQGTWVLVDQKDRKTHFHLFERKSLSHKGSFKGNKTANTDGIAVTSTRFPGFPKGCLFAVDNDIRVAAFSWEDLIPLLSKNP